MMLLSSTHLLIAAGLTALIWIVFFAYFSIQSRKNFNVNFVPLTELYLFLFATIVVWVIFFVFG